MLGFMGITMFFSMWMSNTATTAMVAPMVEAVIESLTEASYRTNTLRVYLCKSYLSYQLCDKFMVGDL